MRTVSAFRNAFISLVLAYGGAAAHADDGRAVQGAEDDFVASLRNTEADHRAPVDFGYGPGVRPPAARKAAAAVRPEAAVALTATATPAGGPTAGTSGMFAPEVAWPIIPIHMILLPDGRVLSYGSDEKGAQGASLWMDVWDPTLGSGTASHLTLPNTIGTDIFCSSQSILWGSGQVLISGGDLTVGGQRNYSNNNTEIFSPTTNSLASNTPMNYARWYATVVPLPNGQMLELGGRLNRTPVAYAPTPEIFTPATGTWTTLPGATSNAAFGSPNNAWYYPRAHVAPDGTVFVLEQTTGKMFSLNPSGSGSIVAEGSTGVTSLPALPTIMFAPGMLLSIGSNAQSVVINLNASPPTVTPSGTMSQVRFWASGTVLPDGRVLVTGGSTVLNTLTNVAYSAEIWDPATGKWTLAASAVVPRLYHSNALLLPDGSVLTGGGGAPGPVKNLNAEIYYPSYLYLNDGSGMPAPQPTILAGPGTATVGSQISATVGPTDTIGRVTFLRFGSATHSNNFDQRFFDLPFTQTGQQITATLPGNANVLMPGYYLMFVFNQAGTPSVASTVLVPN